MGCGVCAMTPVPVTGAAVAAGKARAVKGMCQCTFSRRFRRQVEMLFAHLKGILGHGQSEGDPPRILVGPHSQDEPFTILSEFHWAGWCMERTLSDEQIGPYIGLVRL